MPIAVTCPCGRKARVKDEFAGRKIRCPECREVLVVPKPAVNADVDDEAGDLLLTEGPEDRRRVASAPPPPAPSRPRGREQPPKPVPLPSVVKTRPGKVPARKKREPRVAFEEGWFGSINSGVIGGILMIVIAVVWFVVGLMGGVIFFYPPILAVIGIIAMFKGLFNRQ